MHYEIVYENGEHSVADYKDTAEMLEAVREQHRRAKAGEAGYQGPTTATDRIHPAQRIVKVYEYDKHPADMPELQFVSADVAGAIMSDLIKQVADKDGVVDLLQLREVLADTVHPMQNTEAHESNYKLQEKQVLTSGWDD